MAQLTVGIVVVTQVVFNVGVVNDGVVVVVVVPHHQSCFFLQGQVSVDTAQLAVVTARDGRGLDNCPFVVGCGHGGVQGGSDHLSGRRVDSGFVGGMGCCLCLFVVVVVVVVG